MADEQNGVSGAIGRFLGSFLIHAVLCSLTYSLITFWLTAHFEDASEKLRSDYPLESDVTSFLGEAASNLTEWCLISFLVSFLASCLFLYQAQVSRPRNPGEGATRKTSWIILFFVCLAGLSILWWEYVSIAEVQASLMSGNYQSALGAVAISTLLAYFLGTLLFVKLTMRPSVPLGNRLPSSPWN